MCERSELSPDDNRYRRETDFYAESVLLWLEVDVTMRKLTQDHRSMNDFCRLFFGGRLASVAREAGGEWVIRFERGSGALLTDLDIAAAVSPLPLDTEQRGVIETKAEWLAQLP